MGDVFSRLARLDRARGLDLDRLREGARHWRVAALEPGTLLWKQGRTADSVGLVLAGELSVLVDGVEVGRACAGDLVGDLVTAIPPAAKAGTLRADTRVEVALLPAAAQLELRAHDVEGMEALTRHALRRITGRTIEAYVEMAMFRDGALARPRREVEGAIGRLARRICRPDTPPPVVPWLTRLQPVQRAGEDAIAALAAVLTPIRVCAGDVVSVTGEDDSRVLLVVDGAINVLFEDRAGRTALLVAQVGPPALLGTEALAGVITRSTSIAAASSGWLFAVDAADCEHLPAAVRLALTEAALASATTTWRDALRSLGATVRAFARTHTDAMVSRPDMRASDSLTAMFFGER
jgi:CRP-like cAMP-binding protein